MRMPLTSLLIEDAEGCERRMVMALDANALLVLNNTLVLFVILGLSGGFEKEPGMKKIMSVVGFVMLTALSGFGQSGAAFFRIIAPTNTKITAFDSQGYLSWTNAATAGVTCTVQRATTLAGPSNWVEYAQHVVTNATIALRVYDRNPPLGMELIPEGWFQMGDTFTEGYPEERPRHTVYVGAFYMDNTVVTKAKWDEVATWAAANGYDLTTGGALGKAASHPAHTLTWYRAVKWCNARSQKEGLTPCYTVSGSTYKSGYRLPTEAEWEKAARGGLSGKRFPWGNTINHNYADYYANSSAYTYDTSPYTTNTYHPTYNDGTMPYTSPVGAFAPNGYGLYDMAGNVWEWCWDWYASTYYSGSSVSDPRGPSSGSNHATRGGSWSASAFDCRAAVRGDSSPTYNVRNLGFRPVRKAQ